MKLLACLVFLAGDVLLGKRVVALSLGTLEPDGNAIESRRAVSEVDESADQNNFVSGREFGDRVH